MSLTKSYYLALTAQKKLGQEAFQSEHNLRRLVGHANLLDVLLEELDSFETKPEVEPRECILDIPVRDEPRDASKVDIVVTAFENDSDRESDSDAEDDDSDDTDNDDEDDTHCLVRLSQNRAHTGHIEIVDFPKKSPVTPTSSRLEALESEVFEIDNEKPVKVAARALHPAMPRNIEVCITELQGQSEELDSTVTVPPQTPTSPTEFKSDLNRALNWLMVEG